MLTLTKAAIADVANKVAACASLRDAMLLAGMAESTGFRWLAKGESDAKAEAESLEREFWEAVDNAKARRRLSLKLEILKAARGAGGRPGEWKAAQALGSMTDPKEFVPQLRVHVTSQFEAALDRIEKAFMPHDPAGYEVAIRAMAGGATEPEEEGEADT